MNELTLADAARAVHPFLASLAGTAADRLDKRLAQLLAAADAGEDVDDELAEVLGGRELGGWTAYFLEHGEPPRSWAEGRRTYLGATRPVGPTGPVSYDGPPATHEAEDVQWSAGAAPAPAQAPATAAATGPAAASTGAAAGSAAAGSAAAGSAAAGAAATDTAATDTAATDTAFPRLDAPGEVAPGDEFTVTAGLRADPDAELVSTGEMALPVSVTLQAALQFDPRAFVLLSPETTVPLPRTPDDPWPTAEFTLIARASQDLRAERRIDVKFLRDGQLVGFASRALLVRAPTAGPVSASTAPAGQAQTAGQAPAAEKLDLSVLLDDEVDLLVFIRPSADVAGTRLVFTTHSRHADLADRAEPFTEELHGEHTIGTTPQQLGKEARLKVATTDDALDAFSWLRGLGVSVFRSLPSEIGAAVRAAVAKGTAAAPARILLFSEDPYVPWELAVDPVGWPSTAGGTAPFLGAHAAISRWYLGDVPPPRPRPVPVLDVRTKALVSAHYEGVTGWPELPEAEAEVERLRTALAPDVEVVPPAFDGVLGLLNGTPQADLLHFALHGNFDPQGIQGGLVLIRVVNGLPRPQFLQENHVLGANLAQEPFVYLNACQVAAGDNQTFGGYGGLAAAFLTIGARGVIAPLWNIDDETASALAGEFYRLSAGPDRLPAAEILRRFRARYTRDAVLSGAANVNPTLIAFQLFGHPGLRLFPAAGVPETPHG